jgi:replication factor C subunit 3/5
MKVHTELEDKVKNYVSHGLLNTIFYGPRGSGKHTLVLKMLNSLKSGDECEKEKVRQWEDSGVIFYSTSTYIRFDARECMRKKANLLKIIEEIGRTRDISADSNKVIYIRYVNYLRDQQEAFRQLVEDSYLTCRYIFTCRNIDTIDPALNSRCFLIRVPAPSDRVLDDYVEEEYPELCVSSRENIVRLSQGNMNTLKNLLIVYKKKTDSSLGTDVLREVAQLIQSKLKKTLNLSTIHSIAEKYHYSEFVITDICMSMDNIENIIIELQEYSSLFMPSLYDTIKLFLVIFKKT